MFDSEMKSKPISSLHFNINKVISDEEMEAAERREREAVKLARFKRSGVGERYWNLSLEDYKTETQESKAVYNTVCEFIRDIKAGITRSLWLTGASGTGKTMLAAMIIKECGGCYRKSYQLVNEARRADSYNSSEDKNGMINRYAGYRLLVIDEVGKDTGRADEEWNILWQIINERYENMLPIVIVSNLAKSELAGYFGQHIVDRFVENGKTVEFTGESYRPNLRTF